MSVAIYTVAEIDAMIAALPPAGGGSAFSPWIDATAYGASPAALDNHAALQAAIDAAWANGWRKVALPAALYRISAPIDISGVTLEGPGPVSGCGLVITTAGADCVTIKGQRNGVHVPGGRLAGMGIFAEAATSCGIGIKIGDGTLAGMPDRFELEGLRMTTAPLPNGGAHGTWQNAIWGSGTARTSPPGIRGATVRDVEFFNVRSPGIVLHGITNLRMESVNGFTGAGNQSMTGIWIGGTAVVKSNDVQVSDCRVDGPINVTNTEFGGFEGRFWGGIQYDASAVGCVFSTD